MSYLGYVEGLARVSFRDCGAVGEHVKSHLYRGTFGEVGAPLCPMGWRMGVKGDISIFRENTGGGGLCERCMRAADRLGPNQMIPHEGLEFDDGQDDGLIVIEGGPI